uniref:AP-3 complex subunit delta-1 n=1 Tax=Oncorhynchus tshawytscha TaxID=74940 RepID=A0A8C8JE75_ONCTS
MALKIVKGSIDRMFDKNLQDLVRGIRNHKEDEAKYISTCIDEIKQELKQDNIAVKANAVCKLTYLQMLGYDVSWAAFNIVEVMSSSKFTYKRIGYLAASQCFHESTDVIMLTTNQIRKDLSSPNQYDTGVALTGLSCFVTPDLARDLANDIMTLMSHTKPYIRKKAVLIMYKVFLKYPESLRPAFPRLKEKLEDPDPGVQSAAVNVICELARRNPKNYLSLAPLFFKLMTSSTNNWVLIKIIKLFGALTPLEPRLGKKLIEPLTNLIHSRVEVPWPLSVLSLFIVKYLGLLAMSKILKTHPKSVQSHKDLILQCLDDKDESIRLRALDLLYGMVSKKNLMEIVKKLMLHVDKAEGTTYRDELLTKIIDICSQSNYQYITNFEWYISILVELTRLEGTRHGHLIASQMLDVAIRVKAIRAFAVAQMATLLDNAHLLTGNTQRNGICEVLYAAAWICGEFSEHLEEPMATLEAMLRPKVATLPGHIQAVYVQNAAKLFATVLRGQEGVPADSTVAQETSQLLIDRLPLFVQSSNLEVQERASCILQLVKYIQKLQQKDVEVAEEVTALFAGELNPVAPKAQKKVPVPEGLDLDVWINEPPSGSESEDEGRKSKGKAVFAKEESRHTKPRYTEVDEKELAKRREVRKAEQANNPFYIKASPSSQKVRRDGVGVEHIPVVQIDLSVPLKVPGMPMSDQYVKLEEERRERNKADKKKKKDKKKREKGEKGHRRRGDSGPESEEDITPAHMVDIVTEEMPENALPSDDDDKDPNDPHKALNIDLDNVSTSLCALRPLADSEKKLPVRSHRPDEVLKSPMEDRQVVEVVPEPKKKTGKEKKEKKDRKVWLHLYFLRIFYIFLMFVSLKSSTHKKKKQKKEKKKKKHHHNHSDGAGDESVQNGTVEEEEPLPVSNQSPFTLSINPCPLCQIPVCDIQGNLQDGSQVVVSVIFENKCDSFIKSMEFNVLDSLNSKLQRPDGAGPHDGLIVPFQLPPGISNEARFIFSVQNIMMPQKLKGTLTFIVKTDDSSTHEKLDFKLHFTCTSYLITTPCYSDAYSKLLESGDLKGCSLKLEGVNQPFHHLLARICFHHHFSVVERIDSCASMYSRSIQGHHMCLLVKTADQTVSIDAKCDEPGLLGNVLDEIKLTFSQC